MLSNVPDALSEQQRKVDTRGTTSWGHLKTLELVTQTALGISAYTDNLSRDQRTGTLAQVGRGLCDQLRSLRENQMATKYFVVTDKTCPGHEFDTWDEAAKFRGEYVKKYGETANFPRIVWDGMATEEEHVYTYDEAWPSE